MLPGGFFIGWPVAVSGEELLAIKLSLTILKVAIYHALLPRMREEEGYERGGRVGLGEG